jgi:NTP pyrophosphatase (non-canonical NTP hydrolase)
MEFKDYQFRVRTTDQNGAVTWPKDGPLKEPQKHNIIPLLGLVGEVGGLLSEYKKMLRDGALHEHFPEQAAEELGDILWYVATVATKFDLDLDKIAQANIKKTADRWHEPGKRPPFYDEAFSANQQLPRTFSYTFGHREVKGEQRLVIVDNATGEDHGAPLKDNAYEDDGYRFHDIMHLTFAVHLGWSPVWRKLLRDRKINPLAKRTPPEVDDAEDGGRPQVIEEGVVHAAYVYADQHHFMEGVAAVDWQLLRHISQMTANLEVKNRTAWEWNKALINGFQIWRELRKHNGGLVEGDLKAGSLKFTPPKTT